ncbi:MAG TPA: FHA domain-containing protein [Vicinamibacterales bacterium]|nr:FHA domain-containing protein [Vicinamibacterales bacterium]
MRRNLEPLRYSTLAPSRFVVYLHPDEFSRIEPIMPVLRAQTSLALDEELAKLNEPSLLQRYAGTLFGPAVPVENVAREWQVEFVADADDELKPGDILVHSELALPGGETLGAGQLTRRIETLHVGRKTTTRELTVTKASTAVSGEPTARLHYEDDSGKHTFVMVRDPITVGRGGQAHRVDLQLDSSVDVSREHLRIRRDAASNRFFITDLSMLGTTVNGQAVPRGYEEVDGTRRENGVESELPDGARIALAGVVHMQFEIVR